MLHFVILNSSFDSTRVHTNQPALLMSSVCIEGVLSFLSSSHCLLVCVKLFRIKTLTVFMTNLHILHESLALLLLNESLLLITKQSETRNSTNPSLR